MERYSYNPPEQRSTVSFSPGSLIAGGLVAHSKPLEPGRKSNDNSFPTSNHNLTGSPGNSQPTGTNPFPVPDLDNWLFAAPWNHIQGSKHVLPRSETFRAGNTVHHRPSVPAFPIYQDSIAASECETTGLRPLPSDSGYESLGRTQHSIVNGSIFGDCDRTGETASVVSGLLDRSFDRSTIPLLDWTRSGAPQSTRVGPRVEGSGLICPFCRESVKTKSELKKHKQRHEKPYHCDVPGCTRAEGFSTTNDVDRHKKSCHPNQVSDATFYRCTVDSCRYPNKKWPRADNFRQHLKRVHNIQVGENDLEQYTYKPPGLPSTPDLNGLGTAIEDSLPSGDGSMLSTAAWRYLEDGLSMEDFSHDAISDQQPFQTIESGEAASKFPNATLEISPTAQVPTDALQIAGSQSQWKDPEDFSEATDNEHGSEFARLFEEPSLCHDNRSESDHCSVFHDGLEQTGPDRLCVSTSDINQQPGQSSRDSPADLAHIDIPKDIPPSADIDGASVSTFQDTVGSGGGPELGCTDTAIESVVGVEELKIPRPIVDALDIINDDKKALTFIKALKEKGMLTDLLQKLGYQSPQPIGLEVTTTPAAPSNGNENNLVCQEPGCTKAFSRRCELKKHEKRHVKPYACTFTYCEKKFGSKNDWKRHENSQHYQLELWKCNETTNAAGLDGICGKTCHRREQFRAHLAKDHNIMEHADVNTKLEQCLVGHNCDSSFWCGFCIEVIEVEDKGLKAWTSRFNHIDDHFSGRGRPKMNISQWKSHESVLPKTNSIAKSSTLGSIDGDPAESFSASPLGGARRTSKASKRPASDEAQHQPLRKKGRLLLYCCRCKSQLDALTGACFHPDCDGHRRCDSCSGEWSDF